MEINSIPHLTNVRELQTFIVFIQHIPTLLSPFYNFLKRKNLIGRKNVLTPNVNFFC